MDKQILTKLIDIIRDLNKTLSMHIDNPGDDSVEKSCDNVMEAISYNLAELDKQIAGNQPSSFAYLNDLLKPYPDDFVKQEWCTQEVADYLKEHWPEVKNELAEELGNIFKSALGGACDTILRKGGLIE